jgi:hypothetical protein
VKAGAIAVAIFTTLVLTSAQAASASGLQPIDLRVEGGEEAWHAQDSFALYWSNPAGTAAVHYRLLKPTGQVAIGETRLAWAATSIPHLRVPYVPGAYTAELWLEDSGGGQGTPITAKLRFDNVAPGQVEPAPVPAWIGHPAFPLTLRLGHPAGPVPLAGIRGYAVLIDGLAAGGSCLAAGSCGASEIELRRGIGDDSLALAELPEGTSYLHAVAVSGSGIRSAATATTALHVDKTDPVTRLSGNLGGWSNQPLTLTASATDGGAGMAASQGGSDTFTAIRIDAGTPVIAAGGEVKATVIASGIHTVAYYARDAAGNADDGGASNGRTNRAPTTATVRIDREPPRLAFAGAQDPLDPERIEVRASDSLSGLDPALGSIAVRPAGSGERFVALPTERTGTLLRAHWDSETYPPGEYEFRATAYDIAGNSASTSSKIDGTAMRLPSPLKISTTLLSGFGGAVLTWHRCVRHRTGRRCREETVRDFTLRPAERTVPYGRRASFSGRLIAGRQAPLAGMPVKVIERFDPGAVPQERVSTVRTGADGAFSLRLDPGPNRQLLAVASPTATLRGASSKPLRLEVQSGVRIRASSAVARIGGRPLVFRGAVAGDRATIPADGKIVQLQFRLPGSAWSEFRTIRTDPHGHFRYPYRFTDDDSRGARFQFRAFAPAQAGWPYEPAGSMPVAVLGS